MGSFVAEVIIFVVGTSVPATVSSNTLPGFALEGVVKPAAGDEFVVGAKECVD